MGVNYPGIPSFLVFLYCSRTHSIVFAGEEMKMSGNFATPTTRGSTSSLFSLGFGLFSLLALTFPPSNAYAEATLRKQ